MNKKVIWWIPTIFWCLFIFFNSHKPVEASNVDSRYLLDLISNFLSIIFGSNAEVVTNALVRKAAHFAEYLILGVLLHKSIGSAAMPGKTMVVAFLSGVAFSILDEFHQFFIPGRSPKLLDVFIDTLGLASGLIAIFLLGRLKLPGKRPAAR